MNKNKAYLGKWEEMVYNLPPKSAKLIIADPPYFQVKGDFDFIWDTMEDYLIDVEKWAKACKYALADNGTLFVYGHAKNIAYVQIIFDKYFNLENALVWRKTDCKVRHGKNNFRCFAPVTERILMYSNEVIRTGLEEIKLDVNNFKPLRNYFEYIQKSLKLPKKDFLDKVGQCADHCFRWKSSQWNMPTESTYDQLIEMFRIDLLDNFKTYEELRQTYEELRRPFNNVLGLEDVMDFAQEVHITGKYDHDTKKPPKLTRALILTCSRKNDLVLIPFAGSGTECEMAVKERREFIGFDIKQKYVDMTNNRCNPHLESKQVSLLDFVDA